MRLLRGILDNRLPLRHHCRHHNIDCGTDTRHIEINMVPDQIHRFRLNHTMLDADGRSKCFETLDMLVDRPASDIASPGEQDMRAFVFAKQRPKQIVGPPYLSYIIIRHYNRVDCPALYEERCPLYEKYADIVIDADGLSIEKLVKMMGNRLKGMFLR